MDVRKIDGYLLAGHPAKAELVAELAAEEPAGATAPFLRALRAVGVRAADETLVALRLVATGRPAGDDAVRRIRALAALARDPASAADVFARDGAAIPELAGRHDRPAELARAARLAYERELE